MVDISKLKVFKFESGETEHVIAKDYQEAYKYYSDMMEEDLEDYYITEVIDWYYEKVRCEMNEEQEDGTYWKMRTMAEIAEDLYWNGYDSPEVICTTCL